MKNLKKYGNEKAAAAASAASAATAATADSTHNSNVQDTEDGVKFINDQVLNATATPMTGSAKIMADQAAGMMLEDMRGFVQGMEQLVTVGMGQAIAQVLAGNPNGAKAVEQLTYVLSNLATYAINIGAAAAFVESDSSTSLPTLATPPTPPATPPAPVSH
jgi:hypothetical protein